MWFCLFVNIKNREQTKMCSSSSIIDKIYSVIRFNQGRIYVSDLTYHKKGGDMEGFKSSGSKSSLLTCYMGADITCVTTVCGWWNYSSTSLNTMKLYTDRGNFKSLKVIAALEFTGLSYSLTECGLEGKVKTNMPMFTSGTLHDHTSSMCSICWS